MEKNQPKQTPARHRAAAGSAPAREADDHALAYLTTAISQVQELKVQMSKLSQHGCTQHNHHTMKKVLDSLQQYAKSRQPARCTFAHQMNDF
jgi:hypothetical protein